MSLESVQAFSHFRKRLDELIQAAWEKYQDKMQCRAGCFSCCRNDFRISLIEAVIVKAAVRKLPPPMRQKISENLQDQSTPYCPLLVEGRCSVYGERPVLCRIFGFPVTDGQTLATCELNFTEDRAETFTAQAFDRTVLSETTEAISRLHLAEMGRTPSEASEKPPMFRIQEVLGSLIIGSSAGELILE